MAKVITMVGEKLLIQIGDGGSPTEIFAHPCLINADRGMDMTSESNTFVVPDCDDPSRPGWNEVFKDGLQISVQGGGMMHTPDFEKYFNWMNSDDAKNIRIKNDVPGAVGGGYIAVPMKLMSFNSKGQRKNNTVVEISLMSHGPAVWVDGA